MAAAENRTVCLFCFFLTIGWPPTKPRVSSVKQDNSWAEQGRPDFFTDFQWKLSHVLQEKWAQQLVKLLRCFFLFIDKKALPGAFYQPLKHQRLSQSWNIDWKYLQWQSFNFLNLLGYKCGQNFLSSLVFCFINAQRGWENASCRF